MAIKITHGVFRDIGHPDIVIRNTEKYLPLPLKFRKLLQRKFTQWWNFKTSIYRFGRRVQIPVYVDEPVEFTVAHDPMTDVWIISIVHPLDQFCKKAGVRIVLQRMEWALNNPDKEKSWKYELKKEECEHKWKYFIQGIFNYKRCEKCKTVITIIPEVEI